MSRLLDTLLNVSSLSSDMSSASDVFSLITGSASLARWAGRMKMDYPRSANVSIINFTGIY